MPFALFVAYAVAAMALTGAFGGRILFAGGLFAIATAVAWVNTKPGGMVSGSHAPPIVVLLIHSAICFAFALSVLSNGSRAEPGAWTLPIAWWMGVFWTFRRLTVAP